MKPYEASFPSGSRVRIADRPVLEEFLKSWSFHNPLKPEQLAFAGRVVNVAKVGFYHGGDPLYLLDGVPGGLARAIAAGAPVMDMLTSVTPPNSLLLIVDAKGGEIPASG